MLQHVSAGSLLLAAGCVDGSPESEGPIGTKPNGNPGGIGGEEETREPHKTVKPKAPKNAPRGIRNRLYFAYYKPEQVATGSVYDVVSEEGGAYGSIELVNPQDANPDYRIPIWINSKSLEKVQAAPGVKKVEPFNPEEMIQVGQPVAARGKLYVTLAPNSWRSLSYGQRKSVEHHPTETVAWQLTEKLKDVEGVEVLFVAAKSWEEVDTSGIEVSDSPGQVLIRFSGESVPQKVLDALRSHPQVSTLRWGTPLELFHCPGCGLG